MNVLELTLLLAIMAFAAGFLGSLTGMGGGIVIVPGLTLLFGVEIRYAIGAALISVIATSSGAAAAYVKEGFANIRLGLFLEIATTIGAVVGAFLATKISGNSIAVIFGGILLYSAYAMMRNTQSPHKTNAADALAVRLRLDGTYPLKNNLVAYHVRHVPLGFALMLAAGILSGLLGIGSGALKVLAMDRAMQIPFKVSTTTSNFMIGVTAAASAGIYLNRGYIDPGLAMPVMLGVLAGSMLGARVLAQANVRILKIVFSVVVTALAAQMIINGILGKI
ncbi:MAG: sulfite exporter TauE/SafE family protein [Planctomycetaceae bacterium]|nr:sulfite exporter TauE/SafE family protein [Planctomycetaceae bacterium]